MSLDERWKSTSMVVNLKSALTDGWNVHTSNNPSDSNGQGGTCFGDSGGGVYLNNTNVVVAVVSFGINNNCKGADYQARTDIADSQDFINDFLN
jgi:secreted trypsin-like serine protease